MTIHRFFVSPDVIQQNRVSLPEDISRQIGEVLRLKHGDHIIVLDNTSKEYEVELDQLLRKNVAGKIIEEKENNNEPQTSLTLYQALLPREKFEMILQKGTEIGISRFVPVVTERSLLKEKDVPEHRYERWNRIIQEAAEQSERGKLPFLAEPMILKNAFEEAVSDSESFLAWERGDDTENSIDSDKNKKSLFIGPEGGFSEREVQMAQDLGVKLFTFGKRILRAETAAIVGSGIIIYNQV